MVFEGKVIGHDLVSFTDPLLCKACGQCVSACPANARSISPSLREMARQKLSAEPGIVAFACKFGWGYASDDDKFAGIKELIPVICIGKVKAADILAAFTRKAQMVSSSLAARRATALHGREIRGAKKEFLCFTE